MLLKNMQGRLEPSLFYERDRYVCPSVDGAIQREECLVARIGFRVVDDAGLAAHELVTQLVNEPLAIICRSAHGDIRAQGQARYRDADHECENQKKGVVDVGAGKWPALHDG